ncbi:MAG: hypothetical protein KDE00_12510 [Rhodobacteraceae bacterium]|nr:hypothetical protein [Paracoccaceae bacterium]
MKKPPPKDLHPRKLKSRWPILLELLRELTSTLAHFEHSHAEILKRVPAFTEKNPDTDTLIAPLTLACLDAAYAIKEIVKAGVFEFVKLEDPNHQLLALDRTRARKRHPQKFIENTINSGKSHATGVHICYGFEAPKSSWNCRTIIFNGALGGGNVNPLFEGLCRHDIWKEKQQIIYFVGTEKPVNLSALLLNFREFAESLLVYLIELVEKEGDERTQNSLLQLKRDVLLPSIGTFTYTLKSGR